MGCCQIRESSKAEEFVIDTLSIMKITTFNFEDLTTKMEAIITLNSTLTKKEFMKCIREYAYFDHYEVAFFNDILSGFTEKFTRSQILFFLIAFLNNDKVSEDKFKILYETLFNLNGERAFTIASLQKYMVDYITFYTSQINKIFLANLKSEHKSFENELVLLNKTVYTHENICLLVKNIINEMDENEIVTLSTFREIDFKINVCDFRDIRNAFLSSYELENDWNNS